MLFFGQNKDLCFHTSYIPEEQNPEETDFKSMYHWYRTRLIIFFLCHFMGVSIIFQWLYTYFYEGLRRSTSVPGQFLNKAMYSKEKYVLIYFSFFLKQT